MPSGSRVYDVAKFIGAGRSPTDGRGIFFAGAAPSVTGSAHRCKIGRVGRNNTTCLHTAAWAGHFSAGTGRTPFSVGPRGQESDRPSPAHPQASPLVDDDGIADTPRRNPGIHA